MPYIYLFINITIFRYQQHSTVQEREREKAIVMSTVWTFIQSNDISGNFYLLLCVLALFHSICPVYEWMETDKNLLNWMVSWMGMV